MLARRTLKETTISVIIPILDEESNLRHLVKRLHSSLAGEFLAYELIFIDDRSSDNSLGLLSILAQKYPIQFFEKRGQKGKAFSLLEGFGQARYELVAMIDADLQYPPEALPNMAQKILEGAGVVVGRRKERKVNAIRKIFSRGFAFFFCRLLHGLNVDVQSGIKVFKHEILRDLFLNPTPWTFDLEFLLHARSKGNRLASVDVVFEDRGFGESKIDSIFHASWEIGMNALKLKFKRGNENFQERLQSFNREDGFDHNGRRFEPHSRLPRSRSAFKSLLVSQKFLLAAILAALGAGLYFNWHGTLLVLFAALTIMYFVDLFFNLYLIFATFRHDPEIKISEKDLKAAANKEWPLYTIFCPLYKEWHVLPQFAQAIKNIDYPKNRLQVMLLLEEDDQETITRAKSFDLPENFEIRVVPHSLPKTKPKAMNYGLKHALGEYIVVYDAEDMPDPKQLKKAVLAFERLGENTLCVQAKLNYYNPRQNLLTRIFTLEYSLWFDLILPGLQSIGAPIPLGGTSNHFKAQALKALHGWDAFNVTEDCDLGMRMAKLGYRTAIIDSTTLEEANSKPLNWFRQRSRWIKGYLQTYFVHSRKPKEFFASGNPADFAAFQLVVGSKILSLFINPLMWLITAFYFLFRAKVGLFIESFFPNPILYIGVISFVLGNFLYLYYYMIGCVRRGYFDLIKYAFIVPFYWLAMSFAALKAGYEVVFKPHYWAKTVHGLHLKAEKLAAETLIPGEGFLPKAEALKPSFFRRLFSNRVLSGAGFLVMANVFSNFLNFVYSAFLGRALSAEQFGLLSLFNTFSYLVSMAISPIGSSVNYRVAYLSAKKYRLAGGNFYKRSLEFSLLITFIISLAWAAAAPWLANFFNIPGTILIYSFSPFLVLLAAGAVSRGFLQGNLNFGLVAIVTVAEFLTKLASAFLLVYYHQEAWVVLSLPLSVLASGTLGYWLAGRNIRKDKGEAEDPLEILPSFPKLFYGASLLTGIGTAAFLSLDLVLAKHYLDPVQAGQYALLSLVGKMIFFFGSLFTTFITTFVRRDEAMNVSPSRNFHWIFASTLGLSLLAFAGLAGFNGLSVSWLLGNKAAAVVPYVLSYGLAIVLFTMATTIISFHLARRHYSFSVAALAMSVGLFGGIVFFHANISDFVRVILITSLASFGVVALMHLLKQYGRFIFRGLVDLSDSFFPVKLRPALEGRLRILVLNWRDTKHEFAGGAEVYVNEMAKRWAAQGHSVTLFCGNDGKLEREENSDGVQIIRRGGFYFVYVWAFVYYLLQFRGRFDIIIDAQNGVPFFAPMYAKEPVYCLMHHVHQEVFFKYLSWPLAQVAAFLEKRVMPWAYKNTKFITISESSKKEILLLGLGTAGIEIVYPGVNLEELRPAEKPPNPLVLYLGRLKAYKSIDVLIKSFKNILLRVPNARLAIVGGGEEQKNLEKLAKILSLEDKIIFTGKVTEGEKLNWLQKAWVFVNPSMMEGWGITSIEANACGVPVVAADVPGLRDSVQNPHTGYLVKHGDVEKFSQRISELIEDTNLWQSMRNDSIEWAKNFDWDKSSQKFLGLLKEAAEPALPGFFGPEGKPGLKTPLQNSKL